MLFVLIGVLSNFLSSTRTPLEPEKLYLVTKTGHIPIAMTLQVLKKIAASVLNRRYDMEQLHFSEVGW